MAQNIADKTGAHSPLERAKSHEKIATYSIALVIAVVVVLVGRAMAVSSTESATDQHRLMSAIMTLAEFIVTLGTLALVRHQVSVAVQQIEQAEQNERRFVQLTYVMQSVVDTAPGSHPADTARRRPRRQQAVRSVR